MSAILKTAALVAVLTVGACAHVDPWPAPWECEVLGGAAASEAARYSAELGGKTIEDIKAARAQHRCREASQ